MWERLEDVPEKLIAEVVATGRIGGAHGWEWHALD